MSDPTWKLKQRDHYIKTLEAERDQWEQKALDAEFERDRLQEEVLGLRGTDIPVLKREVARLWEALERIADALDFHCAEDDDAVTAIARQALRRNQR